MDKRLLTSALALAMQGIGDALAAPARIFRTRGPAARNPWRVLGRNRFKPHQSLRERARRVGGDVLASYRQASRIHRGLPPTQGSKE